MDAVGVPQGAQVTKGLRQRRTRGEPSCPGQQREIGCGRMGSIDAVRLDGAPPEGALLVPALRQPLGGENGEQGCVDLRV